MDESLSRRRSRLGDQTRATKRATSMHNQIHNIESGLEGRILCVRWAGA